jgi:hypothetical protein
MKLKGITWLWNKSSEIENDRLSLTNTNYDTATNQKISVSSTGSMSTYKTSRTIARTVSIIGWFVVVLSVYGLFHLGLTMMSLYLIVGGFVSGILLVVAGQFTRAVIDAADNTSQILALMKSKTERDVQ